MGPSKPVGARRYSKDNSDYRIRPAMLRHPSVPNILALLSKIDWAVTSLVGAVIVAGLLCVPSTPAAAATKPFGIATFSLQTTEASQEHPFTGQPYLFTQAGGHPFALTSTIDFTDEEDGEGQVVLTGQPKNLIIDLPAGLVANPQAIPQCSRVGSERCPADTQVGVFVLHSTFGTDFGPIVNLTPQGGQVAVLGLETPIGTYLLTGHVVRTAQGYTTALVASGLPTYGISSVQTTFWGVPAASAHNAQRGVSCAGNEANPESSCLEQVGVPSGAEPAAFLTLPSYCSSEALSTVAWVDSWEHPNSYALAQTTLPAMSDCNQLPFSPELTTNTDTSGANEPVGINLSIGVRQSEGLSTAAASQLREAAVTLPEGLSINPAAGEGSRACEPTGPEGIDIPTGVSPEGEPLGPGALGEGEELGPEGVPQLAAGHCPEASVIGSAEALTPLLARMISGRVYLASPRCGGPGQGPCNDEDAANGDLYRTYVELDGKGPSGEGMIVKIEGHIQANPMTGQLTLKLTDSPQLPLSELKIKLFGGPRALLANPTTCGPAVTTSIIEPWSAPYTANAYPTSYYNVTGCTSPRSLNPTFFAGSDDVDAGAFSAFATTVVRDGNEQYLLSIQLHAPPGLSAMLSSVPLCQESLANTGECSEASRIGSSIIATGSGSQPLYLNGDIYLTAAYKGAPFGLSIVTKAVAGPLNLGLDVVRTQIGIDPRTAALTITSDPLPQIMLGVPLRIQSVTLNIDRPKFIFNPTNCDSQQITATITGTQGASATVSSRFALGGCYNLAFKPKLTVSTDSHTNYADGAGLQVQLTFPKREEGVQANLARLRIVLPKQLPSRLTSLQSACPNTTFAANPAACPQASIVGTAKAHAQVLSGELTGPVYFVSHGRNAFPSPIVVLQGDGVNIDLVGSTAIESSGLTRIGFDSLPDIPINSLELSLLQGPHSVLSANANLCALIRTVAVKRNVIEYLRGRAVHHVVEMRKRVRASLLMPTELVAQNGTVIHQSTKIKVSGCTASKAKTTNKASPRRT